MLSLKDRKVLSGRKKGLTYSELGKLLDVGKERARAIEQKCLRKLYFAISKKYPFDGVGGVTDRALHLWMGRNWRKQKYPEQCHSNPTFSQCVKLARWMLIKENVEEACMEMQRLGIGCHPPIKSNGTYGNIYGEY